MTEINITVDLDSLTSDALGAALTGPIERAISDEMQRQLHRGSVAQAVQVRARTTLESLIATVVERRLWDKHWSVIEKVVDHVIAEMEITTK